MFARRRPLARAAIVGGTAYVAGKHVQQGRTAEQEQNERLEALESQQYAAPPPQQQYAPPPPQYAPPPPPPAAAASGEDIVTQLEKLASLKEKGILTDAEFDAQKARILGAG
jgi:hypothetical protein